MKVQNMTNSNGNKVENQFIITDDNGDIFFQSYQTIIAKKLNKDTAEQFILGKIYLDSNSWDYSKTTGKYRNIFLGETRKETEAKIKSGEYILTDLNK